jgi:hypothetical protein
MVRVNEGEKEAKVLFLNNEKSKGWEGPFDVLLTMEAVVDFSLTRPPRALSA